MDKKLENLKIKEILGIEDEKIEGMIRVEVAYLNDEISLEEAKKHINESYDKVTGQEFALCEQYLPDFGISDEVITKRLDDLLEIFEDVMVADEFDVPEGHPIHTYMEEVKAIRAVLEDMKEMLGKKFIKNEWMETYDKLREIKTHFDRKQNQLYPALEKKDFNKPAKVMWTLEDNIEDIINKSMGYLENDQDEDFLKIQDKVIDMVADMMDKEQEVLYPVALDLLTDSEFAEMRRGDDEIGYCLIDTPPKYKSTDETKQASSNSELLKDLSELLSKHGVLPDSSSGGDLDVSQGKLTLEQINLIFRHLKIDLSYVDENDIMKFYTDTEHRVFPRSPGVIGREVQNCHPRDSVDKVEEIVKAFREGTHDEAEFWLDLGDKFIYINYTAVRDKDGKFRGVLEMMQDATRVRSLKGSQRLVSWKEDSGEKESSDELNNTGTEEIENKYGIDKDTKIGDLVKEYPYIKNFMLELSPKFKKLKNPILFKTMSSMATLEMISEKGDLKVEDIIEKIVQKIDSKEN